MAIVGVEVAAGLGCADAATAMQCLRRIPAADLTGLIQVALPAFGLAAGVLIATGQRVTVRQRSYADGY